MPHWRNPGGVNEFSWNVGSDMQEINMFHRSRRHGDHMNNRYRDAYGDYNGGYDPSTPPLGFGPLPGPPFWGRPPQPLFAMGRGFGPGGPPAKRFPFDDRPIKYLLRCGVAKENVKNLPRELLQLIEPQHCGICAMSFDSFPSSRLHYISKNHLKLQKRWLAQRSDLGIYQRKEMPIKARELYCELCDVHITSKQHADSHYSGKLHRAIVEGRKNPKNPMLLQRNMEERLDLLIRREKKYLKDVSEYELTQEKDGEPKKKEGQEKKPCAPELYCDICKTSVTCTEQMTMHLNGKKHLNKEKQHILKMMKAGIAASSEKKDEENTADVTQDVEEADKGDQDGQQDADDSFDWGNGSGAWDEADNQ